MTISHFLLLTVLGGTCIGTVLPSRWMPRWLPNDKVLHAVAYFLLLQLALLDTHLASWVLGVAGGLFLLGVLLELIQRHIPGRGFSMGDVVANGVGIATGLTLHAMAATF